MRVRPGRTLRIETEPGEITAPTLVLGLNGWLDVSRYERNEDDLSLHENNAEAREKRERSTQAVECRPLPQRVSS